MVRQTGLDCADARGVEISPQLRDLGVFVAVGPDDVLRELARDHDAGRQFAGQGELLSTHAVTAVVDDQNRVSGTDREAITRPAVQNVVGKDLCNWLVLR